MNELKTNQNQEPTAAKVKFTMAWKTIGDENYALWINCIFYRIFLATTTFGENWFWIWEWKRKDIIFYEFMTHVYFFPSEQWLRIFLSFNLHNMNNCDRYV